MSSDRTLGINVIIDGTNYPYWSHLMQNFLKEQKLWKYIAKKIPTLHSKDTTFEEWEASMGKINSWIANAIALSIGNQLAKFSYPKDAWDYLAKLYTRSNAARRLEWEFKNVFSIWCRNLSR